MSNEPVAWGMPRSDGQIVDVITPEEHARVEGAYTVPLYAKPQQRKPLTDDEILEISRKLDAVCAFGETSIVAFDFLVIARAIERAHGIGGEA